MTMRRLLEVFGLPVPSAHSCKTGDRDQATRTMKGTRESVASLKSQLIEGRVFINKCLLSVDLGVTSQFLARVDLIISPVIDRIANRVSQLTGAKKYKKHNPRDQAKYIYSELKRI